MNSHVVVFIHGLHGKATDIAGLRTAVWSQGLDFYAVSTFANTAQGIESWGEVMALEILKMLQRCLHYTVISFIAHSLGGLVVRYALSELNRYVLYRQLHKHAYISLSSPHLGSRSHIPSWVPSVVIQKAANLLLLMQLTTFAQLMMYDNELPLLVRMAQDAWFVEALAEFHKLVAYANPHNDYIVDARSASLVTISVPQHRLSHHEVQRIFAWHPSNLTIDSLWFAPLIKLHWTRFLITDKRSINGHVAVFETPEFFASLRDHL